MKALLGRHSVTARSARVYPSGQEVSSDDTAIRECGFWCHA